MYELKNYIRALSYKPTPMNVLDKKEFFAFLDKWFKIYPESTITTEKTKEDTPELAQKKSS